MWENLGILLSTKKYLSRSLRYRVRGLWPVISTCVDKCSDPPKLSFGSMGKQHQSMNATKATLVPTRRMKSSIDWKNVSKILN